MVGMNVVSILTGSAIAPGRAQLADSGFRRLETGAAMQLCQQRRRRRHVAWWVQQNRHHPPLRWRQAQLIHQCLHLLRERARVFELRHPLDHALHRCARQFRSAREVGGGEGVGERGGALLFLAFW